jgi:hypothetical protein
MRMYDEEAAQKPRKNKPFQSSGPPSKKIERNQKRVLQSDRAIVECVVKIDRLSRETI